MYKSHGVCSGNRLKCVKHDWAQLGTKKKFSFQGFKYSFQGVGSYRDPDYVRQDNDLIGLFNAQVARNHANAVVYLRNIQHH